MADDATYNQVSREVWQVNHTLVVGWRGACRACPPNYHVTGYLAHAKLDMRSALAGDDLHRPETTGQRLSTSDSRLFYQPANTTVRAPHSRIARLSTPLSKSILPLTAAMNPE